MADFGGFSRFTYSGNTLRMRGKFDTEPADSEFKELTNTDGSVDRTQTPMAYRSEVIFIDTDDSDNTNATPTSQPWNDIIKGGRYNITVVQDAIGIMHTWTGALFVGRPKVDRNTGEVTGLQIVAPRGGYKQTTTV